MSIYFKKRLDKINKNFIYFFFTTLSILILYFTGLYKEFRPGEFNTPSDYVVLEDSNFYKLRTRLDTSIKKGYRLYGELKISEGKYYQLIYK